MSTPHPQGFSIPQRNQILRQFVEGEQRSKGSTVGRVDSFGWITFRYNGPYVITWGNTWADIGYGNPLTLPGMIVINVVFVMMCCGLYLPVWFFRTFKKPPVYRISIDEYGYQQSVQHGISRAQKIQRWVLLAVMALIGLWFLWGMATYEPSPVRYGNFRG